MSDNIKIKVNGLEMEIRQDEDGDIQMTLDTEPANLHSVVRDILIPNNLDLAGFRVDGHKLDLPESDKITPVARTEISFGDPMVPDLVVQEYDVPLKDLHPNYLTFDPDYIVGMFPWGDFKIAGGFNYALLDGILFLELEGSDDQINRAAVCLGYEVACDIPMHRKGHHISLHHKARG